MVTIAQRLDGCLDDVLGGFEVRLTDAEIDNILAAALQFGSARQNLERGFGPQPLQIRHELQHDASLALRCTGSAAANDGYSAWLVLLAITNSRSAQRRKGCR
jgi:hypothetical protein